MKGHYTVGLGTTFHDPALAILGPDGEILFAEATERYLQNKRAINCEPDQLFHVGELLEQYCADAEQVTAAMSWAQVSSRIPVWTALAAACGGLRPGLMHRWALNEVSPVLLLRWYQVFHMLLCVQSSHLKAGANLALAVRQRLGHRRLKFRHFDHHLTHAMVACHTSPFDDATCLIVDGIGDRGSVSCYRYRNRQLSWVGGHRGRESLGALFMLVTELCGFSSFKGEEWKVMGLASYGKKDPTLYETFRRTLRVDGINLRFPSSSDLKGLMSALEQHRRQRHAPAETAAGLAATWQEAFSDIMTELLVNARSLCMSDNLVLAGGCALNSAYAGQIRLRTGFAKVHIPSAPADDGAALGAALLAYAEKRDLPKQSLIASPFLGTSIKQEDLLHLKQFGPKAQVTHHPEDIARVAAGILAQGKIIGWMQGRAEFGPRALGNRSILADPRPSGMKDRLNKEVKFREAFRPFAPAVLQEHGASYFEDYQDSPYMERTLRFRPEVRDLVPAVVHVDGTGRLQTVTQALNQRFHELLSEFYALTSVPVLLNTSFNVMGKPIVHSIEDALGVFYKSGLDALVIEDYLIRK